MAPGSPGPGVPKGSSFESLVEVSVVYRSPGVGLARSTFNFITLIIGGGLLAWPSIFRMCGWLGGCIALCVVCVLAQSTMALMVKCAIVFDTLSYEETCRAVWGPPGYYIVALSCYLLEFGVLVTYWVALGDLAEPFVSHFYTARGPNTKVVSQLVLAAMMLPPCFLANLGNKPAWSYINYTFILIALTSLMYLSHHPECWQKLGPTSGPDWRRPVKTSVWPCWGALAFTFCVHDSVFAVYQNLDNGTFERWNIVCSGALWSTVILMISSGLAIYSGLGESTQVDVTLNFKDVPLILALRAMLVFIIAITWIYLQQVARKYLHSLVMPLTHRRWLTPNEVYMMSCSQLFFFTSVQFGVTLILGIYIRNLALPMALTGMFAQSLVAFVIPPCLLLTTMWRGRRSLGYSRLQETYFCFVLLVGIVSCTLGAWACWDEYASATSAVGHGREDKYPST